MTQHLIEHAQEPLPANARGRRRSASSDGFLVVNVASQEVRVLQ